MESKNEVFESLKKSPRLLLWFIVLLTVFAILVNLPSVGILSFTKALTFKKGLDLAGGTSVTLKADMKDISVGQRDKALEAVKTVIKQRTKYF